jgi:ABC-type multidrug transport system ATPase subunit
MAKERNHAIVLTIHMPRENIIALFDNLILMSKGNMAWFGPVDDAVSHLNDIGFSVPGNMNPADHMLDLATIVSICYQTFGGA